MGFRLEISNNAMLTFVFGNHIMMCYLFSML
jgi:hypothetical protein